MIIENAGHNAHDTLPGPKCLYFTLWHRPPGPLEAVAAATTIIYLRLPQFLYVSVLLLLLRLLFLFLLLQLLLLLLFNYLHFSVSFSRLRALSLCACMCVCVCSCCYLLLFAVSFAQELVNNFIIACGTVQHHQAATPLKYPLRSRPPSVSH